MGATIQVIAIFLIPYLIMIAQRKFKIVKKISPTIICYGLGLLWTFLRFVYLDKGLSMTIAEVCIPIAIPLVIYSADFVKWLKSTRNTIVSFILIIISAMLASIVFGLVFRPYINEAGKLAGMMVGCYTGGTPNLMAIGMSLGISEELIVLANTCDAIIGGIYFLLLISVMKPLLSKVLKPFKTNNEIEIISEKTYFMDLPKEEKKKSIVEGISLFSITLIIVGISVGVAMLLTGKMDVAIIMLLVTSGGIAGSFSKKISKMRYSFELGQYFILVFSFAIGSTIDFEKMLSASPLVVGFICAVMFGAITLHILLAKIFKIDVDTAIITATAAIYGPVFIVPVANAIDNKKIIISGLTCGLIGYAIGNYLGILISFIVTNL